jgi:hypothetical protein
MGDLISVHHSSLQDELASVFSDAGHTLQIISEFQEFADAVECLSSYFTSMATVINPVFAKFQSIISWHIIKAAFSDFTSAAKACKEDSQASRLGYDKCNNHLLVLKQLINKMFDERLYTCDIFHLFSRTFTINAEKRRQIGKVPAWKILGFRSPDKFHG